MKKLCIFFFFCFFSELHASEARRLIVLFDWEKERITQNLDKEIYDPKEDDWGPISGNLITALAQKAAPIIVTSSLWHNFVARRKLFKDFLEGRGREYKNKYARFKDEKIIAQFQKYAQAYFQSDGEKILGNFNGTIRQELDSYFMGYVTPFEEKDWMLKKASDYIYVLIPKAYLEQLKSKPLPQSKSERSFATTLDDDDLYLGLKISKMETMSYQNALNPDKHKITVDRNYAQLLNKKDADVFMKLASYGINPPEDVIISKHFIKILENIFVTKKDLVAKNKDVEKTELNRVLYLHKWHIYLSGHGSLSNSATLQEINIAGTSIRIEFAYLAGIELRTFREWLFFLNSSINIEFLFYESCYSGGEHLHRPYEHQWDYSAGKTKKIESRPDIFNYMIVAGNLAYTVTSSNKPSIYPPYKKVATNAVRIDYQIQFPQFFEAVEKYFSIDHVAITQKKTFFDASKKLKAVEAEKKSMLGKLIPQSDWDRVNKEIENLQKVLENLHFITLNKVIDYVHDVARHRPAVRYPGTEWFVPLPLDEKKQVIERLYFETSSLQMNQLLKTQARKKEKERAKEIVQQQAQKHIQKQKEQPKEPKQPMVLPVSESALVKALHDFKQKLVQLKNNISKFKF